MNWSLILMIAIAAFSFVCMLIAIGFAVSASRAATYSAYCARQTRRKG